MSEENKQQNTEAMQYDTVLAPVDNPESDCYGCDAGMCDHLVCNGDQYQYLVDNADPSDYVRDKTPPPEPQMINKTILVCSKDCGWQHNDPKEYHNYEKATNGRWLKTCPRCFGWADAKTIQVPDPNGC